MPAKMNCIEFRNIIDLGHINREQLQLLDEHMTQCAECKNYFMVVNFSIEHAGQLLESSGPPAGFSAEIGQFVFDRAPLVKAVPLWTKIATAAAAIALGLFIGSAVYDSRTSASNNQELSYINSTNDTVLMAETTEIMYFSLMEENEGE